MFDTTRLAALLWQLNGVDFCLVSWMWRFMAYASRVVWTCGVGSMARMMCYLHCKSGSNELQELEIGLSHLEPIRNTPLTHQKRSQA